MASALSTFECQILDRLSSWPGIASRLLSAWVDYPSTSPKSVRALVELAQLGVHEERRAEEVLKATLQLGLTQSVPGGHIMANPRQAELFRRVAFALNAIDHYKTTVHRDATSVRVVLTKPARPCVLEKQLSRLGWRTYDIDPTDHAFKRMVQMAESSVLVMTPFLDATGGTWLMELFAEVRPGVAKQLVLRSLEDEGRTDYPIGFDSIAPWLKERRVEVFNYSIPRSGGYGRETFHAKVVLCDEETVYLGSSNVNRASLEHSMEMGVELIGKAARDVAVVLEAVRRSAQRWF